MAIEVHLDQLLLDRKMTLTELSNRVGITQANLSNLKTGKARAIRFTTLNALCKELHCQPADLLSHTTDPEPPH
ncbi:MAG: helix-turn-helix transcriptional regulator [Acidimicrobiia bacterium]|nr:helix-turn-helix transcriptional regulator [Acidimicrobiia bacterium]